MDRKLQPETDRQEKDLLCNSALGPENHDEIFRENTPPMVNGQRTEAQIEAGCAHEVLDSICL